MSNLSDSTLSPKHGELSQLIGETITSYHLENTGYLRIVCESGKVFHMTLQDEGCGCNDSYAFFQNVMLITDHRVTAVRELEGDRDGAKFIVECKYRSGIIEVVHESNGYYSWQHSVTVTAPDAQTP